MWMDYREMDVSMTRKLQSWLISSCSSLMWQWDHGALPGWTKDGIVCVMEVYVPTVTKCQHWFVFKLCCVKVQKSHECYLNMKLIFSRPRQSKRHDVSLFVNCLSASSILNVYSLCITANMTAEADARGEGRASLKLQATDQAAVFDVMVVRTRWKSRLDQTA